MFFFSPDGEDPWRSAPINEKFTVTKIEDKPWTMYVDNEGCGSKQFPFCVSCMDTKGKTWKFVATAPSLRNTFMAARRLKGKKTIYKLLETALREEGEMLILSYLDILSYPKNYPLVSKFFFLLIDLRERRGGLLATTSTNWLRGETKETERIVCDIGRIIIFGALINKCFTSIHRLIILFNVSVCSFFCV